VHPGKDVYQISSLVPSPPPPYNAQSRVHLTVTPVVGTQLDNEHRRPANITQYYKVGAMENKVVEKEIRG